MILFHLSIIIFTIFSCVSSGVIDNTVEDEPKCELPQKVIDEIASYKPTVQKIINATLHGLHKGKPYEKLAYFVDKFGPRVSGTANLESAITYMIISMYNLGLENVHGEEVLVPHWVRGRESAKILKPVDRDIPILGLGTSVPGNLTAKEVIVVKSFEELEAKAKQVLGKIVVFNNEYVSYGISVKYRSEGASRASALGAVAALVRSVTPFSMRTLHTGGQSYARGVVPIPVASITVEDARFLQRLQDREQDGEKIIMSLSMESKEYPLTTSRNTVCEIEGSQQKEKVVLVSGHLDSWDVGVGAMDDGGGAFISWYSLLVLKSLGLRAKRTIRSVLWTGEEPGLYGVIGYNKTHAKDLDNFVFVMESDEGTFTPQGLVYTTPPSGYCILKEVMKLMEPLNATQLEYSDAAGSDISIWTSTGIPGASLKNAAEKYFWFHHSAADTMDVLDSDSLDKATALWASVAYVIADMSVEIERGKTFRSKKN